jgi:asparagine synthase (glutamine-hydrolysing)
MLATDMAIMLPDDFLTKVDRASMAYGLEVRPPMVDHEWMELAWQLPSQWKIHNGETKWMLKRISQTWLPQTITHRPKQGFEIPLDEWLRGPLGELFHAVVLDPASPLGTYLDLDVVRRLFEQHGKGIGRHGNVLWSILVLAVWMERYLTNPMENSSAAAATPRQQVVSQ